MIARNPHSEYQFLHHILQYALCWTAQDISLVALGDSAQELKKLLGVLALADGGMIKYKEEKNISF